MAVVRHQQARGAAMSERYSTQESESVVSDLMQAAAGPYQDDELLDLTARSIRIIAAAMQDEIEFRAGFVRRSVEMEARAEAAEQQAARLRAALINLASTADRTVSELMALNIDRELVGTLGLITNLDISVIEAKQVLDSASQPAPADEAQGYATRPYLCVTCGGQYRIALNARLECDVVHPKGACCHRGQIVVIPPPPRGGQAEGEG